MVHRNIVKPFNNRTSRTQKVVFSNFEMHLFKGFLQNVLFFFKKVDFLEKTWKFLQKIEGFSSQTLKPKNNDFWHSLATSQFRITFLFRNMIKSVDLARKTKNYFYSFPFPHRVAALSHWFLSQFPHFFPKKYKKSRFSHFLNIVSRTKTALLP